MGRIAEDSMPLTDWLREKWGKLIALLRRNPFAEKSLRCVRKWQLIRHPKMVGY